MKPRILLTAAAYSAWFAFVFVVLTWVTFPWSKVRDQAMVAAHSGDINLQMDSMRAGPFGATVSGLSVGSLAMDGEGKSPWVQATRAKLKTGPISLFSGAMEYRAIVREGKVGTAELIQRLVAATGSTRLDADMYGGSVDAEVEGDDKTTRFKVDAKNLDLSQYPVRAGMFEADPTGALDSNIDVLWNWSDPRKTSGSVDIDISNFVLAGFKASGFAIPQAAFDRSEAHLKIKSGKAEFRETAFESEVVTAEVGGFITLKKGFMRSTLSLNLKFKVRPDLDGLLKLAVGKNARHRDDQGWYHYQVLGSLARPNLRPSPIGKRGGSKARKPPAPRDLGDDDDDSEPRPSSRVKDRRSRDGDDAVERPAVDENRRQELEDRRTRLREERRARRERQREARRKKALDRAAQLDPSTLEDLQPSDDVERVNEPEDLEVEQDFGEPQGEFNDGDGDFNEGDGSDGDYQD
jgi:type II secretion system protein N